MTRNSPISGSLRRRVVAVAAAMAVLTLGSDGVIDADRPSNQTRPDQPAPCARKLSVGHVPGHLETVWVFRC